MMGLLEDESVILQTPTPSLSEKQINVRLHGMWCFLLISSQEIKDKTQRIPNVYYTRCQSKTNGIYKVGMGVEARLP